MGQVIRRLEAEVHAGLGLQGAADIRVVGGGPAFAGGGTGLDPLLEADQPRAADPRRPAGARLLSQDIGPLLVVALDPAREGPDAAPEGLGDGDGILTLGGEDDGLMALPGPLGGDGPGEALEFFQGKVVVDMHGAGLPGPVRHCETDRTGEPGRENAKIVRRGINIMYIKEINGIRRASQACPMCDSSATVIEFVKEDKSGRWALGRCERCGLHFTDPRPSPEYLKECYSGDYHKGLRALGVTEKAFGPKYRRYVEWMTPHLHAGSRVLDIGCATGGFVKMLCDRGFSAEGLELNGETAAWGREHYGITIHNKTLEECRFSPESFDAVILTDVLEHTLHPRDYLAKVGGILAPDGTVLITFPDLHSLESRYYRLMATLTRRPWLWKNLHIPLHTWEFTKPTAEACFEGAGFEIVAFRRNQVVDRGEGSTLLRMIGLPSVMIGWPVVSSLLGTQMEFKVKKLRPTRRDR